VTGEKLGGQKWGCWHSLLEIKEGGQVAGQYVFCSLSPLSLSLSLSDGLVLQVQRCLKI
jgi:hypothetical protein